MLSREAECVEKRPNLSPRPPSQRGKTEFGTSPRFGERQGEGCDSALYRVSGRQFVAGNAFSHTLGQAKSFFGSSGGSSSIPFPCHCEERSDEAISHAYRQTEGDCFACPEGRLAMTRCPRVIARSSATKQSPSPLVSLRGAQRRSNLLSQPVSRGGLLRLPGGRLAMTQLFGGRGTPRRAVPCHCEERSDEAISCAYRQAVCHCEERSDEAMTQRPTRRR